MVWSMGSLSWLVCRVVFTGLMLGKKTNGVSKLLGLLKVSNGEEAGEKSPDCYNSRG